MGRAVEQAYSVVRDAIVAGEIPPGGPIREGDFAVRAGVSRTPVREALQLLASEGFIEVLPNRGARVVAWSLSDLEEVFSLRALLEPYAAEEAARRVSASQLKQLNELADRMLDPAARHHLDKIAEWNNEFHALLIEASGKRQLNIMVQSLLHLPLIYRTFRVYSPEALQRSLSHHKEIVSALRAGDAVWAGSVMRSHVHAGYDEVRTAIAAGKLAISGDDG